MVLRGGSGNLRGYDKSIVRKPGRLKSMWHSLQNSQLAGKIGTDVVGEVTYSSDFKQVQ